MLDGIRFENMVHAVSEGADITQDQEWYRPVVEICKIITQSQYQVKASRPLVVDGVEFVCYGILDFLKAGVIYDTKFSTKYRVGKYLDSPQHPMYFYLCPEVREFEYIISDGSYVYREAYLPEDTEPIETIVRQFMKWLDKANLVTCAARTGGANMPKWWIHFIKSRKTCNGFCLTANIIKSARRI